MISSIKRLVCLSVVCVLLAGLFPMTLPAKASDAGARDVSSRFLVWDDMVQVTNDHEGNIAVDSGFDTDGNIHAVWINRSSMIFYAKLKSDGTPLTTPRVIGTSDMGNDARPKIAIDGQDKVHVTWANDSGPNGMREFTYVQLDNTGSVLLTRADTGGDIIAPRSNGFLALRFYNDSSPSAPEYGPMYLHFYGSNGLLAHNMTVGTHKKGFEYADMVVQEPGIMMVFLYDSTSMNYTMIAGWDIQVNQTRIVQSIKLASPQVALDSNGLLHVLWIDGRNSPYYVDSGVYMLKMDHDGNIIASPKFFGVGSGIYDDQYMPIILTLTNRVGSREMAFISNGYYYGMGSGGDELPNFYFFGVFNEDGDVIERLQDHLTFCSNMHDGVPSLLTSGPGLYYLLWGQRECWSESGGGINPDDLHFMRSKGDFFIDLAISEDDVLVPDIFLGEEFLLHFKVRNLGNTFTTDFYMNVSYTDNGTELYNVTDTIGPGPYVHKSYDVPMTISSTADLTLMIDPLDNIDSNLTNNSVQISLVPRARPDPAIFSQNISFSEIRPVPGEQIEIFAQVNNLGGYPAEMDVVFFDGIDGPEIGRRHIFSGSYSNQTSIFWNAGEAGEHIIAVLVQNVTPSEPLEKQYNNFNHTTILVGSHAVPSVQITSPTNGTEIDITLGEFDITGEAWDPDEGPLTVFVKVDQGDWEPSTGEMVNHTFVWSIRWNISDYDLGDHTITAKVLDDIHEDFNSTVFVLVEPPPPPPIFDLVNWSPVDDPVINETETMIFSVGIRAEPVCAIKYQWYLDNMLIYEILNDSSLTYTAGYGDAGTFSIRVNASCDDDREAFHHWTLKVLDKNRPPIKVGSHPAQNISVFVGEDITFSINALDHDYDVLNYTWISNGKSETISDYVHTINWTEEGNYTLMVVVDDGKGGTFNYTWNVEVKKKDVPKPPRPPGGSSEEGLWWLTIPLLGIIIIIIMAFIYRQQMLRKERKEQEALARDEEGAPVEDAEFEEMAPPGKVS